MYLCMANSMNDPILSIMKKLTIQFILLFAVGLVCTAYSSLAGPEETAAQVSAALQAGNAADVAKYFNPMVDLTLPGYDDSYSKTQAGQILKDFFTQNPVKGFKVTKQGSSPDGTYYTIGTLETGKKNYQVYFLIKTANGQNLIQQLQLQES
jgi:hypothetical protein